MGPECDDDDDDDELSVMKECDEDKDCTAKQRV